MMIQLAERPGGTGRRVRDILREIITLLSRCPDDCLWTRAVGLWHQPGEDRRGGKSGLQPPLGHRSSGHWFCQWSERHQQPEGTRRRGAQYSSGSLAFLWHELSFESGG